MLSPGQQLDLTIDKPAAGGRMIARHDGQVVLVAGAIPGERVRVRVERVERRLAFAIVDDVREASPDRRVWAGDQSCGGCVYAHIAPGRQLQLKAEVIADALTRIGRIACDRPIVVRPSPERGYRIRARLHVREARIGFYREHTHDLCDPAATGQLGEELLEAAAGLAARLHQARAGAVSIEVSETLAADQRIAHVDVGPRLPSSAVLESLVGPGLDGVSVATARGARAAAGPPRISDPLDTLTKGRAAGSLERSAEAFFQGNRYLLPDLVTAVMDSVAAEGEVLDLYAGVGLFGAALAAAGRGGITAVEGHAVSGADLRENAARLPGLTAVVGPVERQVAHTTAAPATVIVDPPRTGLSADVLGGLTRLQPPRIVYVSCDPATLARDARGLTDAGYGLSSLEGFDLFPNTAHVESLAVFTRG
jgi:tRNA/tmRNA/rRNA uracil-C5-methylase (TrmA/RlmC/RlmD family)